MNLEGLTFSNEVCYRWNVHKTQRQLRVHPIARGPKTGTTPKAFRSITRFGTVSFRKASMIRSTVLGAIGV